MTRLACALPVTLVLSALIPAVRDALRFTPQEGLELRTSFEREARLELVSMEMTVDGASHGGMPVPEISLELRAAHDFVDRYATVDEGRVTRLVRTFEELSDVQVQSVSGHEGSEETTHEAESDLEGRTVEFRWDAEDEEYSADFEDGEGDSSLLEGLEARLDLAEFLPDGEVDVDDSWDVPAAAFRTLIEPGGNLHLDVEEEGGGGPQVGLSEDVDGTIRATLRGTREEAGVTVAVIGLEVEVSSLEQRPLEDAAGDERQTNEFTVEGELLWDPAVGRLHSLELGGEVRTEVVTRREVDMGGQVFETVRTLEFAGEVSYRLRAVAQ